MWSKKRDGSVNWSEPAKLFLIDLLKKNIVAISEDTQSLQKSKAWKNIYDACLQKGMPRTSIDRITRIWTRMKIAALKQQSDQKDSMLISKKLGQAIIGLLNRANFRDMMPKVSCSKLNVFLRFHYCYKFYLSRKLSKSPLIARKTE